MKIDEKDIKALELWAEEITGIKQLCLECGKVYSVAVDHKCEESENEQRNR